MHHQFLSLIAIVVAISVQTATAKPIPVTQGNTAKPTGENPLSSSIECASSPEFSPQSQYPLLAWTGCDGDGRLRVQKRQLTVPYVSNEIWHGGSGGVLFVGNEKDMPIWNLPDDQKGRSEGLDAGK